MNLNLGFTECRELREEQDRKTGCLGACGRKPSKERSRQFPQNRRAVHISKIYIYWLLDGIGLKMLRLGLKQRSSPSKSNAINIVFYGIKLLVSSIHFVSCRCHSHPTFNSYPCVAQIWKVSRIFTEIIYLHFYVRRKRAGQEEKI